MSRIALFQTVPFKRNNENIIKFDSKEEQLLYFAALGGKSNFNDLFVDFPDRNFLPLTETTATLRIDVRVDNTRTPALTTMEALNMQYVIINYNYSNGQPLPSWGVGLLYYFITHAKTINVNTVEYSLELDVFNTYLRGVDWDLPNVVPVDRAHVSRYTFQDGNVVFNNTPYAYNKSGEMPRYDAERQTFSTFTYNEDTGQRPIWCVVVLKTNEGKLPDIFTTINQQGDSAPSTTIYNSRYFENVIANQQPLQFNSIYSPFVYLVFLQNGTNTFTFDSGNVSVSGRDIYGEIQQWLSSNIVNIFNIELDPSDVFGIQYTLNMEGSIPIVTYEMQYGWERGGIGYLYSTSTTPNFIGILCGISKYTGSLYNTFNITNPTPELKYAKNIFDPAILNYEYIRVMKSGKQVAYNKLKLGFGQKRVSNYRWVTDNGVVEYIAIGGEGLYEHSADPGNRVIISSRNDMPSTSDPYTNWLANNQNYGLISYFLNPLSSIGSSLFMGISAAAIPGFGGALALAGAMAGGVSAIFNGINAYLKEDDIKNRPDDVRGLSNNLLENITQNEYLGNTYDEQVQPNAKKMLLNLFNQFGYDCNDNIARQDLFTRYKFNFLKTNDNISDRLIYISGYSYEGFSNNIASIISSAYLNGVREWNYSAIDDVKNPFNYGHGDIDIVENWEKAIFDVLPEEETNG